MIPIENISLSHFLLIIFEWAIITTVIHELSHLLPILIRKKLKGFIIGFIEGNPLKFVFAINAKELSYIDAIAPQIVVPAFYLILTYLNVLPIFLTIIFISSNAISSIQDFVVINNKRKNIKKSVPFYGVGIFFNPFTIKRGWL